MVMGQGHDTVIPVLLRMNQLNLEHRTEKKPPEIQIDLLH